MADTRREDCFVSAIIILRDDDPEVGKFIGDASALLKERYANYELILIDNGLAPELFSIAVNALKQYACIRIIRLSQVETHEVAIFAGLEAAIGDYVVALMSGYDPVGIIPGLV